MATTLIPGQRTWSMSRSDDGHRDYKIKYQVKGDKLDGPANALTTPGLPFPGAYWIVDNELDLWAWCRMEATVTPMVSNEPNTIWELEFTFSTRPPTFDAGSRGGIEGGRCNDQQIEDPLLEPQGVSGTFVKFTEEATHDMNGVPIRNSGHEQVRGPQVEFDGNRPAVSITQNVPILGLDIFTPMVDTVNMFPLWGLPPRCIKLSNVSWERKYYGSCYVYYTRKLEFDIRFDTFDRSILDEGTKVLNGHWDNGSGDWVLDNIAGSEPDPGNPTHFLRATDRNGNPIHVVYSGRPEKRGQPYVPLGPGYTGTGTGPDTVTTSSTCAAAPDIVLNRTYGNFTLAVGASHYFRVQANAPRRVKVVITGHGASQLLTNTGTGADKVIIRFYNQSCVLADTVGDQSHPDFTNMLFRSGEVTTDYMVVQVENNAVNNAGGSSFTYRIIVEGQDPEDYPGYLFVQKYPGSDFLLLGIPLFF